MSSEPTEHNNSNIFEHKDLQESIVNSSNANIDLKDENVYLDNIQTSWDISEDEISIVDSCRYVDDQNILGIISHSSTNENANIGSVAIQNSSDITFGNKNFFNGPVVIKQFFADKKPNKDRNENIENYDYGTDEMKTKIWWRSHRWNSKKLFAIAAVAAVIIVVIVVTLIVSTLPKETDKEETEETPTTALTTTEDPDVEWKYVNRSTWGAKDHKVHILDLKLPLKRVIITHTVTNECTTMEKCSQILRNIQNTDMDPMSKNYSDIGLNFFVGKDGRAYEGRGYRVGAHTKAHGANSNSVAIAFIGNFNNDKPCVEQLEAAKRLITDGLESNMIHPDYKLYGQRQFFATDSPGHFLYPVIKTWPHWSAELIEIE